VINDNAGRLIEEGELAEFAKMPLNERLKWAREELNKIYVGEYSVKKVAIQSGAISHMGLYNMESNSESLPRSNKLQALAEYYKVPVSIFSAHEPESFFLGKKAPKTKLDIRSAQHSVEISFTIYTPEGEEHINEVFTEKMRFIDAEEILQRIQNEIEHVQRRLSKQRMLDEAHDLIMRQSPSSP
jgi:transcriptional regulator with XRE-family HTH domain